MEKFIVSARKYRPITFESVVGQLHITSTLKNAIVNNQLAHAYLFCGPRGVGKTTCARILAKSINCLNPKANAEPCGECESCISFNDSRSFNIHELDAASNNSVNDIRSLTEQVRIPPQVGKYSIYIIDEAHMLSTAAFNAFLKTLEEPPAHAIFILATTEKHKLIPTILSRCQIYDFKRIKNSDLVEYLKFISEKEEVSYDEESLHIIAEKADGCMRDALSMYDKVVSFSGNELDFKKTAESLNVLDYDTYFNFVQCIASGDYEKALLSFDMVLQKGFESMTFINGLAMHLRNLLVSKSGATTSLLEVTGSVAERFKQQASQCSVNFIFDALSIISNSEYSAKQASSIRLHSEMTILKLCNLSPLKLSSGSVDAVYTLPQVVPQTQPVQQTTQPQNIQVQQPQQTVAPQQAPQTVQQAPQQGIVTEKSVNEQNIPVQQPTLQQNVQTETLKTTSVPTQKRSSLGISLKDVKKNANKSQDLAKETKIEAVTVNIDTEELAEKVLSSVKLYAVELYKTRPRIAPIFESSEILNGKISLKVANDIVKEEILIDKHIYLNEIVAKSGIKGLDIEINVMQPEEQKQILPVNDDDKLRYLVNINPNILKLCKSLSLDFS